MMRRPRPVRLGVRHPSRERAVKLWSNCGQTVVKSGDPPARPLASPSRARAALWHSESVSGRPGPGKNHCDCDVQVNSGPGHSLTVTRGSLGHRDCPAATRCPAAPGGRASEVQRQSAGRGGVPTVTMTQPGRPGEGYHWLRAGPTRSLPARDSGGP